MMANTLGQRYRRSGVFQQQRAVKSIYPLQIIMVQQESNYFLQKCTDTSNTGTTSMCEFKIIDDKLGSDPGQVIKMMGFPGTH